MINGLLDLSLWGYVGATLLLTHITIVSVTLFLHRHQAHRALELHPAISHFFRAWLWLTTGIKTKEWVAIHRKHHAKCETPEDPHSPQIAGIDKVMWQGYELYREEAARDETLQRYGKRTPDDWLERHLYAHNNVGVGLMLLADLLLFGLPGITIWAIQMVWIPFWAAGVVNGVGHFWGYRNHESRDASTNISPIGILIGGEELHNNHHTFASSAKLSYHWWEFDIGWMYIRLLQAVGLARVNKVARKPRLNPGKQQLDLDAMAALASHRMPVMTRFNRKVMLPVGRQLLDSGSGLARRARQRIMKLLRRDESLLADGERRELNAVLQENSLLRELYSFREGLQALWRNNINNEGLQKLQAWCRQAESSGIETLAQFARSLRSYTLKAT